MGTMGISAGSIVYRQPTMPQSASMGVPSFAICARSYRIGTRKLATGGSSPSNQRTSTGSSAGVRAS